jgi:hypothetical protein
LPPAAPSVKRKLVTATKSPLDAIGHFAGADTEEKKK